MSADIHKLIAAISPDTYCDPSVKSKVKKALKKEGFLAAAKIAKPFKSEVIYIHNDAKKDPLNAWGLKAPSEIHDLVYDSSSEGLEPVYFWIFDFLQTLGFGKIDKIVDNFAASPGSGHFSEMGQKATRMQEEAMKMLGAANQVLKSILNLIYDLKEMKLLLATYEDSHSKDEQTKRAALLSLKQRWMDMVDFSKRGTTSLKQLAAQMDFVTIIDAFMVANTLKDVKNLDLNDRVKRILEQRIQDFNKWVEESEKQLKARYEIERKYLKSQVATVQLYARWIKPYLKAAKQLEQSDDPQAALVTAFNSIVMQLTIMATSPYDPIDDVNAGLLPKSFEKTKSRKYSSIIIVDFKFRGIPQRVSQRGDWAFGGRVDVSFRSYGLNEEEMKVFKHELERDDLSEMMKLVEGTTSESLHELEDDIKEFLEEDPKAKKSKNEDDINPFTALFSFVKKAKKEDKKDEIPTSIKGDTEHEKVIRSQAIISARERCFLLFDVYKRAHKMAAYQNPYDYVQS